MKKNSESLSNNQFLTLCPGYFFTKDTNGVYTSCNEKMAFLAGLTSPKDIVGKTDQDLPWKDESGLIRTNDQAVIQQKKEIMLEEKLKSSTGKLTSYLVSKKPIYDDSNNIIGISGLAIDITQREEYEEKLLLAKEKAEKENKNTLLNFEQIIASMPGVVFWKNREGVYLGLNDELARLLGLPKETVVGKTDYQLKWDPEIAEAFIKKDEEIMSSGKAVLNFEEPPFKFADGKTIYQLVNKVPLRDENDAIIGVLGIGIDISELKNTQKQLAEKILEVEEAHRSKIEFMCMVSHEIRNPVGNIISFDAVMKEMLESLQDYFYEKIFPHLDMPDKPEVLEEVRKLFRNIFESHRISEDEAKRSISALENLGNLHRIQLQGVKPLWELRNVHTLINHIIDHYPEPSYQKVEFQITIAPSVPQEAIIDYANIVTVLKILIRNAARFSSEKSRVKIKVDTLQENNVKKLTIVIQDFGQGISETQKKHLFDTLSGGGETLEEILYRKPSIQLPQAKMYIEAAGGSVDITSALNQGTIAYITTPYRLPEEKTAEPPKEACRLLLIEDDPIAQQLTKNLLYKLGYHVTCASSGEEAIEIASNDNYDIALLDISLPDISGLAVMREIREKKGDQIIFVAQTSHTSEEDEDRFISQGAMAILKKPLTKDELKNVIEAAMVVRKNLNS